MTSFSLDSVFGRVIMIIVVCAVIGTVMTQIHSIDMGNWTPLETAIGGFIGILVLYGFVKMVTGGKQ